MTESVPQDVDLDAFLRAHGWLFQRVQYGPDGTSRASDSYGWSYEYTCLGHWRRFILRAVAGGEYELEEHEDPDGAEEPDVFWFKDRAAVVASYQVGYSCNCEPRCPGITRQQTEEELLREIGLI